MDINYLKKLFDYALGLNVEEIKKEVEDLKEKYTSESKKQLAWRIIKGTRWTCAGVGFITGIPANLLVSIPAAVADMTAVFRIELTMAAKIATVYDENFCNDPYASNELLIPLFGGQVTSQAFREFGIRGGMGVTRTAIKKYLKKESLEIIKKIALKYFGLKVTQKAILSKTLPVIGGAIGGSWNYWEVSIIGKRVINYFEK